METLEKTEEQVQQEEMGDSASNSDQQTSSNVAENDSKLIISEKSETNQIQSEKDGDGENSSQTTISHKVELNNCIKSDNQNMNIEEHSNYSKSEQESIMIISSQSVQPDPDPKLINNSPSNLIEERKESQLSSPKQFPETNQTKESQDLLPKNSEQISSNDSKETISPKASKSAKQLLNQSKSAVPEKSPKPQKSESDSSESSSVSSTSSSGEEQKGEQKNQMKNGASEKSQKDISSSDNEEVQDNHQEPLAQTNHKDYQINASTQENASKLDQPQVAINPQLNQTSVNGSEQQKSAINQELGKQSSTKEKAQSLDNPIDQSIASTHQESLYQTTTLQNSDNLQDSTKVIEPDLSNQLQPETVISKQVQDRQDQAQDHSAQQTNSEQNPSQNQEEGQEEQYEEDLEEDQTTMSIESQVVEISPKGRFQRFSEELGSGAYKIVYRAVDIETGMEVAWNVINLNRLSKQDRVRIKSEIDLIKKLEHKNIIHFISAWYNKEKEQVVLITEMITGGSLRKYVKRIKTPRLKVIKGWCKQILSGLVYLHEQKPHPIIHRDLKCDNIFINSHSGDIRIGDLGLSTPMQSSFASSVLGTPEFMAPELYEECYGTRVDIYAFGMCVLELVTQERPYKECQNPAQIYKKVINGVRPQVLDRILDQEVKQFILQCLSKAENRPSAKDLLESQFLKDTESEKNNHEVPVIRLPNHENKSGSGSASPMHSQGNVAVQGNQQLRKRHGSTIPEEEDEEDQNSGQNSLKNNQVAVTSSDQQQHTSGGKQAQKQEVEPKTLNGQAENNEAQMMNSNTQQITIVKPIDPMDGKPAIFPELVSDHIHSENQSLQQPSSTEPQSQKEEQKILQDQISKPLESNISVSENQLSLKPSILAIEKNNSPQQDSASKVETKQPQPQESRSQSSERKRAARKLEKKRRKREEKNKMLNESVQFLKKIDKAKQKKLLEQSRAQDDQSNQQNFKDHEKKEDQNDVLGELKKEDMIDLIKKANLSGAGPGLSFSLPKNLIESQPKQIQQHSDGGDAQIPTQKKQVPPQNKMSKEKDDQEGGQTRKFGIEKKFKEDSAQHSMIIGAVKKQSNPTGGNTNQVKNMQSLSKQSFGETVQSTIVSTKNNDTIKKTQSQTIPTHMNSSLKDVTENAKTTQAAFTLTNGQNSSTEKKKVELPKSDTSIPTSLQVISQNSQQKPKPQQQVPTSQFANQPDESVFDVQTSSSSESQDDAQGQDSEVEKIQLNQISGEKQLQQVMDIKLPQGFDKEETHKVQSQILQNTNFSGGQTKKNVPEKSQTPTSKQQKSQVIQFPQQQTQPVKPFPLQQVNSQKPLTQAPLFSQPNQQLKPNTPNQQPLSENLKQASPKPEPKILDLAPSQQTNGVNPAQTPQNKVNQKKEEIKTQNNNNNGQRPQPNQQQTVNIGNHAPQSKTNNTYTFVKVSQVSDGNFKFLYHIYENEVFFDFDTKSDTPEGVAKELVREFTINENQVDVISKQIQNAISKKDVVTNRNSDLSKNPKSQPAFQPVQTNPTIQNEKPEKQQLNTQVQNQSAQQKKSASNLSKDVAMSMFTKLLQDIEFFYSQMQNIGIVDTEEIVDPMDCSNEEKSIRMTLINNVLMAKRSYKQSLETYKLKVQRKAQERSNQALLANTTKPTNDPLNLTFSALPQQQNPQSLTQTSSQTQSSQSQVQQKQQKLQQSPPVHQQSNTQNKNQYSSQQQHEHMQSQQHHSSTKKQSSLDPKDTASVIPQNIFPEKKKPEKKVYQVPQYIKNHFKSSPQQFSCSFKLSKNLKKIQHEDQLEQPDEEVIQLQNLLNFMWHDSIIIRSQKMQTPQEQQEVILKHNPLKIDGIFGEKTEKCVIKFQKYKEMSQNGVVTDHIWSLMLEHADNIIHDAKIQMEQKRPQSHLQQHDFQSKASSQSQQQNQEREQKIQNNQVYGFQTPQASQNRDPYLKPVQQPTKDKQITQQLVAPIQTSQLQYMQGAAAGIGSPIKHGKGTSSQQAFEQNLSPVDYNLLMKKYRQEQRNNENEDQEEEQEDYDEEDQAIKDQREEDQM